MIVKESDSVIIGTIKVSNLSFHKEVIVRSSSDKWNTHEDAFCIYVPNAATNSGAYVLYDTFSFKLALPPKSKQLEFCVCFRCDGKEYWDNNNGANYQLHKKVQHSPLTKSHSSDDLLKKSQVSDAVLKRENVEKCADVMQAKVDAWSEFASWTHLENTSPYW